MMPRPVLIAATILTLAANLRAADDLDWLLKQPTTKPATQPSTQPTSPFTQKSNPDARAGALTLSNGQTLKGQIATTRENPLSIFDDKNKEYRDVPLTLIKSLEASINWERDEKEWQFKETGSDIKEYSGKTYPARELQYKVTLLNGQSITGGIVAPLYVSQNDKQQMFVLNKRQKGDLGQSLKDLLYIKRVDFD
ncbi:MAG: hypothetical protein NTU53_10140 [Planctomycetota bacterium]|nr:hypothetical protein [Planctomycetota bacterium]